METEKPTTTIAAFEDGSWLTAEELEQAQSIPGAHGDEPYQMMTIPAQMEVGEIYDHIKANWQPEQAAA